MMLLRTFCLTFLFLFAAAAANAQVQFMKETATVKGATTVNTIKADHLILDTSKGKITIALRPDLAPQHVARIENLAKQGFYDGVIFHRVIAGFMAQTGDPTGTGTGGSKLPDLKQEFTDTPYERGTVGMARTSDPDSANSQFFITFDDASFLNKQYTVFGQVVDGMDVVDKINKGEPPANPDKILHATVEPAAGVAKEDSNIPHRITLPEDAQ